MYDSVDKIIDEQRYRHVRIQSGWNVWSCWQIDELHCNKQIEMFHHAIRITCFTVLTSTCIDRVTSTLTVHVFRWPDRLVGLVVKASASRAEDPESNPACTGIFPGSSHTSDLRIGTPVATLPGAWRYRVSAGTGRPGVSILSLGEVESLICNFHLSVSARKIICVGPSPRYTSMLLGR